MNVHQVYTCMYIHVWFAVTVVLFHTVYMYIVQYCLECTALYPRTQTFGEGEGTPGNYCLLMRAIIMQHYQFNGLGLDSDVTTYNSSASMVVCRLFQDVVASKEV